MERSMYKSVITGLRTTVAVLLLMSAQVWAADGVVRSLSGGVFINTTTAVVGTEVNSGDTLSTGPGAWVVVLMSDGTVLNLKSDTKVEVSKFVYSASTPASNASDVEIVIGTLRYVSGLIAETDPGDVAIRAGNTTLGLRGSESQTSFDGARVITKVISGNWTSTSRGNTYNAGAGQQMDVDNETGEGTTTNTPAGQRPSGSEGGEETSDLGSETASQRRADEASGEDGGDDDGGDQVPPAADSQAPVFSDDPASTSDPNAGG
jgi:hypothetical protein